MSCNRPGSVAFLICGFRGGDKVGYGAGEAEEAARFCGLYA